jgi:hypothetical protein
MKHEGAKEVDVKLVLYLQLILETFVEILSLFKTMDQVPPI